MTVERKSYVFEVKVLGDMASCDDNAMVIYAIGSTPCNADFLHNQRYYCKSRTVSKFFEEFEKDADYFVKFGDGQIYVAVDQPVMAGPSRVCFPRLMRASDKEKEQESASVNSEEWVVANEEANERPSEGVVDESSPYFQAILKHVETIIEDKVAKAIEAMQPKVFKQGDFWKSTSERTQVACKANYSLISHVVYPIRIGVPAGSTLTVNIGETSYAAGRFVFLLVLVPVDQEMLDALYPTYCPRFFSRRTDRVIGIKDKLQVQFPESNIKETVPLTSVTFDGEDLEEADYSTECLFRSWMQTKLEEQQAVASE